MAKKSAAGGARKRSTTSTRSAPTRATTRPAPAGVVDRSDIEPSGADQDDPARAWGGGQALSKDARESHADPTDPRHWGGGTR